MLYPYKVFLIKHNNSRVLIMNGAVEIYNDEILFMPQIISADKILVEIATAISSALQIARD